MTRFTYCHALSKQARMLAWTRVASTQIYWRPSRVSGEPGNYAESQMPVILSRFCVNEAAAIS
jgi:hypothetical protein